MAVVDDRGRPLRSAGLERWLARVAPASARGAVTIALASDARVRALNREYRHKDYPTDVLSFPSGERRTAIGDRRRPGGRGEHPTAGADCHIGDIVIARGVAKRQARAAGHDERTELRLLALHGLLHLLGYDHDGDGGRMARVERRLRREGGLAEGLIERAGSR